MRQPLIIKKRVLEDLNPFLQYMLSYANLIKYPV